MCDRDDRIAYKMARWDNRKINIALVLGTCVQDDHEMRVGISAWEKSEDCCMCDRDDHMVCIVTTIIK